MATLSEILNARIGKGGKSKASVAAHLGVSERTIENYMNGNRQPKPGALVELAKFLGFNLSELSEQYVPTFNDPQTQYKANGKAIDNHTEKYIELLERQLKASEERIEKQQRLDTLLNEIKKNRALLTTVLEHVAKLRASSEKKPLEKIQNEMGNSYFSALGLDGKTA